MRFKIKHLVGLIGFVAAALWAWRTLPGWWKIVKEWLALSQAMWHLDG